MRKIIISSFITFFFCLPLVLFAANRTNSWIITPSLSAYNYAAKRHMDDQAVPGFSLGYGLSSRVSAALYFGRMMTTQTGSEKRDVRGAIYALDGFYYFMPQSLLQPYLLAGVGIIRLIPANRADADTQANLNAGAGAMYFFSNQIALSLDLRDFYTMVGGKHDFMGNFSVVIMLGGDKNKSIDTKG